MLIDDALEVEPVIGGLAPAEHDGLQIGPLLEHVPRDRVVGVLLVRLGGHAAGVFTGARLVDSKVGTRLVHGRHRKGGSSARRFERRREGQARVALEAAADVAARVLLAAPRLEALVLGGDRRAMGEVLEDARLRAAARAGRRAGARRARPAAGRAAAHAGAVPRRAADGQVRSSRTAATVPTTTITPRSTVGGSLRPYMPPTCPPIVEPMARSPRRPRRRR